MKSTIFRVVVTVQDRRRGNKCGWGRVGLSNPLKWLVGLWVFMLFFFLLLLLFYFIFKSYYFSLHHTHTHTHSTIYYILFHMFDILCSKNVKTQNAGSIYGIHPILFSQLTLTGGTLIFWQGVRWFSDRGYADFPTGDMLIFWQGVSWFSDRGTLIFL